MSTHPAIPNELIARFGLNLLPEAERYAIVSRIGEVIYQAAMRKVWVSLAVGKQDELLRVIKASNAEPDATKARDQVDTFLTENVPDFGQFLEQECRELLESQRSIVKEIGSPQ